MKDEMEKTEVVVMDEQNEKEGVVVMDERIEKEGVVVMNKQNVVSMTEDTTNLIQQVNDVVERIENQTESIFAIFVVADSTLEPEQFGMFYENIKLNNASKRKMRRICKNETLKKNFSTLPAKWSVLYELSKMNEETLKRIINTGEINDATTFAHAKELVEKYRVKTVNGKKPNSGSTPVVHNISEYFMLEIKEGNSIEDIQVNEEVIGALEVLSKYFNLQVD